MNRITARSAVGLPRTRTRRMEQVTGGRISRNETEIEIDPLTAAHNRTVDPIPTQNRQPLSPPPAQPRVSFVAIAAAPTKALAAYNAQRPTASQRFDQQA